MANQIRLKRASGSDPSASDLVTGELAVRTDTAKLFTKKDDNSIAEIGGTTIADGSITSAKIADGAIVNADVNASAAIAGSKISPSFTSTINLTNNLPDIFLTDQNSSNARARLNGNGGGLLLGADNDNAHADSSISLQVDGSTKMSIDSSGNVDIANDSGKLRLGASADLQLYHDGSNSYVINTGTGTFILQGNGSNNVSLRAVDGENGVVVKPNAAVELYHDNTKRFETSADGIEVTGAIFASGKLDVPDNAKLMLGTGDDLQIYHDSSNSYLDAITGDLFVRATQDNGDVNIVCSNTNGGFTVKSTTDETLISAVANGAVELYHDNTKHFETTANGVEVSAGRLDVGSVSLSGGGLALADNDKVICGSGDDLQIYHSGSHSYIQDAGTGNLRITSDSNIWIEHGSENMIVCNGDGSVELYYDNSKKFFTASDGAEISGNLTVSGNIGVSGTVDGRDLATDGSKLDGIAAGATNVTNNNQLTNGAGYITSGGKILQVKNTIKKDTFSQSLNRNTYSNDMGLSVSITPSSSSNKILIVYQVFIGLGTDENVGAGIFKDGSELTDYRGDAAGNRGLCGSNNPVQGASYGSMVMGQFLDSPSTTSSTTYDIRIKYFRGADDQTILLNRNNRDNNASFDMRCCSTITCFEVSA